jgi:hypothetical protein
MEKSSFNLSSMWAGERTTVPKYLSSEIGTGGGEAKLQVIRDLWRSEKRPHPQNARMGRLKRRGNPKAQDGDATKFGSSEIGISGKNNGVAFL